MLLISECDETSKDNIGHTRKSSACPLIFRRCMNVSIPSDYEATLVLRCSYFGDKENDVNKIKIGPNGNVMLTLLVVFPSGK